MRDILVAGAGAAGMMAALTAAESGGSVALLERNEKPGRKLYITGKGRCNLTNDCAVDDVLAAIPRGGKFLYSAMNALPPRAVMAKFEALGVPLKTERGNRVFPVSDRAADVIDALTRALRKHGVPILRGRAAELLLKNGGVAGVRTESGEVIPCTRLILATGGASYPLTGSTGDGYDLARSAGHTVVPIRPSLVPLLSPDADCAAMQGLSLRNVALTIRRGSKVVYREQGELLFTHFGLSGPLILSASAHMGDWERGDYTAAIDLKPALDETKLEARLLRDFGVHGNRDVVNYLDELAPRVMAPVLCRRAGIAPDTKVHSVTREGRRRLLEVLKAFTIAVTGTRPIAEAVVTSGGVKLAEVDPKTMTSKLVRGLYFAGEILDADGYTGGFNLQIAWATGYVAGLGVVKE